MNSRIVVLCCTLLLYACAATGPRFETLKDSFPIVDENSGRVFFYREYASFGAGMRPDIFACNRKVGESIPGGVFYVDLPVGECDISIPTVLYGGERKLKINIPARKTLYLRTWIGGSGFGGRTNMELVREEVATAAIQGLALTK
jgi:hypothetical protein